MARLSGSGPVSCEARGAAVRSIQNLRNCGWGEVDGSAEGRFGGVHHQLADASSGYAYILKKVVRLEKGKPQMTIEHSIQNTGKKLIESNVYNHNFFVIDGEPTGPDFSVKFPFEVKAAANMRGLADVNGKELFYNKELPQGQSAATELTGFGSTPKDFDIRVENKKVGAGVRVTADQPLRASTSGPSARSFRRSPTSISKWSRARSSQSKLTYDFYTFTPASKLGVPVQ